MTVQEMISTNALKVGEWFSFRDGEPVAKLLKSGKLEYKGNEMDMHTCAATARGVKASRVNGFDFWYVTRDGSLISIADIRNECREKILS